MSTVRWLGPAALIAGAGVLLLWLIRPAWYVCASGINAQGDEVDACFDGRTDGPVILFSILLLAELVAVVLLAATVRHHRRREILGVALGAMAATVLVGAIISLTRIWPDAIPDPLPLY